MTGENRFGSGAMYVLRRRFSDFWMRAFDSSPMIRVILVVCSADAVVGMANVCQFPARLRSTASRMRSVQVCSIDRTSSANENKAYAG